MRDLIPVLLGARALRYLGVSVVALGADMGSFMLLLHLGVMAAPASALAYGLGVGLHWWLCARAVFEVADGAARWVQKLLFVGSALVGLGLTVGIVGLGTRAGFDPRLAKIVAVGVSFIATWLLRSLVIFKPRLAAA
ncbi:GtrA family protein [Novosphingobium sediminicola]|uniref:Putative flippase GtrA n=1 Tax=Novosphingobium sediminicola TaxID=563162 RepID=A0A7W6CHE4_9SPHN|nr:GtrA family protein [Novosphingobium sediminicola]MBB3954398.1 putative flippase GtrA [Novosphingobium sediminicola]